MMEEHEYASMGPRSVERGNESYRDEARQMHRRFNGAAFG